MNPGVDPRDSCPCGSGKKFEFCCGKNGGESNSPVQPAVEQSFQLALQHHQAGRLSQAEQIYRQILARQPNHAEALNYLGVLAHQVGRNDAAVELIDRAIALRPEWANPHCHLGVVLKEKGQPDQAIAACRRAIALKPNYPEAYYNLGNALRDKGQPDEAVAAYRQAISLKSFPEAHYNLGNALRDQGQLDQAVAAYRLAIALKPNYPEAYYNLGCALEDKGQVDEAIGAYRRTIDLKPDFAEAHYNLALTGQVDQAIGAYRRAIALKPDFAEAHYNLALALLATGNFPQGWDEHEWRWKCRELSPLRRNFVQPPWDGQPLAGATLLLHAEQGFGDTVQFIRYLPLVAQRGGRVILECQPELQRLVATIAGDVTVVARGQPLPAFDLHCPLLSIPRALKTTLANIPAQVPYLHADSAMSQRWRERLTEDADSIKVGLAWAGNNMHKNDRNRSMPLRCLAPLAQLPGISFYSLQKGRPVAPASELPAGFKLIDWTQDLGDFADTAALIANLDLVISVDTAVAHVAGAMGKPVWLLLPFAPDWRWLQEREDSPWYPTMRLFRQPSIGDWDNVVSRVAEALRVFCAGHAGVNS